jgi:hypothetical protein
MEVPAPEPTKHCIPVPAFTFCDLMLGILCTNYGRKPGGCVEAPKPKKKKKPSERDVVPPPPRRTGSNLIDWDDGTLGPKELPSSVKRAVVLPSMAEPWIKKNTTDTEKLAAAVAKCLIKRPSPPWPKEDMSDLAHEEPAKGPLWPAWMAKPGGFLKPWIKKAADKKRLTTALAECLEILSSPANSTVKLDDQKHEEGHSPAAANKMSHMAAGDALVKRSPTGPSRDWEKELADQEHKGRNPAKGGLGMRPAMHSPSKLSFLLPSERPASGPKVELNDCTHEEGDCPVKANGLGYMPVVKRKDKKKDKKKVEEKDGEKDGWWHENVGWWFDEDDW